MADRTFRVNVISLGIATITAPSKAAAIRRARECDYDSYELRKPSPAITSLGEGKPIAGALPPVSRDVVFRSPA